VVVTKSTVPVGTGDEVERIIEDENPDAEICGRIESRIPEGRGGDRGLQTSRPV